MDLKTNLHNLTFAILAPLTLSVSATPLVCDPMASCSTIDKWQDIEIQVPNHQTHDMSNLQKEILYELIKSQAEDRHEINETVRLTLINLKRLVVSDGYNQSAAKELTRIYGNALAELAYLDIQLAVQYREMLNKSQRKEWQEKGSLHH
ncbi:MAG: hypothetical protein PVI97_02100 [Candidatus Thiodiazotropha sp.]|jgi:hypothetical protein